MLLKIFFLNDMTTFKQQIFINVSNDWKDIIHIIYKDIYIQCQINYDKWKYKFFMEENMLVINNKNVLNYA